MTADQEESWAGYAELCVEDLEPVSCRASAELLLEELAREWGCAAVSALLQAAAGAIATARSTGGGNSWKLREAALQALGTSAENILEVSVGFGRLRLESAGMLLIYHLKRQPLVKTHFRSLGRWTVEARGSSSTLCSKGSSL
jgi:hypothetical protein